MDTKNAKTKLGLWLSTFISIGGLLLIVFIATLMEKILNPDLNRTFSTFVSVIIAIIPPFLWLSIFYRQDRLNPEPKSFVFKTMLLGALIQKAVYAPLVAWLFPEASGISSVAGNYILTIAMVAMIQEGFKLLTVRYSIYPSKEFDEKIDGIIYGSALGLGFATMTSLENILASGGAMLSNVTALVVIETFAHASITGLSCYILGVSKQKKFNLFRLPLALIIATALNAVMQILLDTVTRRGFKVNYIIGLIPAALVAIIVFSILVVISSRSEKESSKGTVEALEPKKALLGILPVWLLVVAAVVTGFVLGHNTQSANRFNVENMIGIQYPGQWVQYKSEDDLFKAGDMMNGQGQDYVRVKKLPLKDMMVMQSDSQEELLQNAAAAWSIKAGMSYRFYQAEKGYYLTTKGKETYVIDYVYIGNSGTQLGESLKPSIAYGRDILSINGDNLYVITLSADYEEYVLDKSILNQVEYNFNVN